MGQDILDALFWTATEPRDRRREHIGIIPHFAMAVVYVCILHMDHNFFFSVDLLGLSYFIIIPCHTPLKQIRQ